MLLIFDFYKYLLVNRSTSELIKIIEDFIPLSEDDSAYDDESYFYDITDDLKSNTDGYRAIYSVIKLMERFPDVDFGSPGPLVHWLESYPGEYETILYDSIKRSPTSLTIWMLNRMINTEKDKLRRVIQISLLTDVLKKEGLFVQVDNYVR